MFSPPFTPAKVILIGLFALALWAYLAWQAWHHWQLWRSRRQLAPEQGLRPEGGRRSDKRKTIFTITILAAVVLMASLGAYVEITGTPSAQVWLFKIESRVEAFMRYMGFVLLGLLALLLLLWWLNRDRAVVAAAKLALAGKQAEAEALIRRVIDAKGPTEQRLTTLGFLLMEQNRQAEGLKELEAAEKLARRPWTAMNNRATLLWKLGRRDEALALMEQVCRHLPDDFMCISNYCLFLAGVGRQTEAYEYLERAERIYERYDAKYTKHWLPQLQECREAAPTARGFPVLPAANSKRS